MSRSRPDANQRDARDVALGMLARREHSRLELRNKLLARGFGETDLETALDRLQAEGLQSDVRFAEIYVRARAERGFGPLKISQELGRRGVSDKLIEEYLNSPPQPWLESARAQHRKRFGVHASRIYKERARQARFLQSRGFSSETIWQVLEPRGDE